MHIHNQENVQVSPDPFPHERVGSGDKTSKLRGRHPKTDQSVYGSEKVNWEKIHYL